jgi:hypothetical protein
MRGPVTLKIYYRGNRPTTQCLVNVQTRLWEVKDRVLGELSANKK